jgi:glutamate synthase domain-containing protein 2
MEVIRNLFLVFVVLAPLAIWGLSQFWAAAWWLWIIVGPMILAGLLDLIQTRSTLRRNFPLLAYGRYFFESIRPEIQQYFVESNTNGRPFSREMRSVVYQRAKGVTDTLPFGTQHDVNAAGYQWIPHSIAALHPVAEEWRVKIGGPECSHPYHASHLNISAMSFGSLSSHAVRALNLGAKADSFYHNTGEGGISEHHLQGGDLVWQIGTGYFGCRSKDGLFDEQKFRQNATRPEVKMIEIKISQGAKPGHGGILPAAKLTPEIAAIRGVPMGQDVLSPPTHSAFTSPRNLCEFVARLREFSGGKPIGFKLCIGRRREFLGICKAMVETGILPDFITVDGGEGGTGAAPLELSNRAGLPMREGLSFVHQALRGAGLRKDIRLIAAGKVITAFDIFRTMALGADLCNSARGMMLALGCIQAIRCNTNLCPVGVATQKRSLVQGLDITDKAKRVERYHHYTIQAFLELIAAAGLKNSRQITAHHVFHRIDQTTVVDLAGLYPPLEERVLVDRPQEAPESWGNCWNAASAGTF